MGITKEEKRIQLVLEWIKKGDSNLAAVNKDFDRLDARMTTNEKIAKKYNLESNRSVDTLRKGTKARTKHTAALRRHGDAMKAVSKETARFKGEWLSIMFTGMALEKAFGGLFKSMISQYKEFTKEAATPLGNALIRLEANWKFLKFAIVEAAAPFLTTLADTLASWARSISMMNPNNLKLIAGVILGLAALGTILVPLGMAALLFSSIQTAASMEAGVKALTALTKGTAAMNTTSLIAGSVFFKNLIKAAGIGAIAFSFVELGQAADKLASGDWVGALIDSVEAGLLGYGGIRLIRGQKGGGALILLSIGFELLEAGMLAETLAVIKGTIYGLFGGILNVMVAWVAKAQVALANATKDVPILGALFGLGDADQIKKTMKYAGQNYSQAFEEGFSNAFNFIGEEDMVVKGIGNLEKLIEKTRKLAQEKRLLTESARLRGGQLSETPKLSLGNNIEKYAEVNDELFTTATVMDNLTNSTSEMMEEVTNEFEVLTEQVKSLVEDKKTGLPKMNEETDTLNKGWLTLAKETIGVTMKDNMESFLNDEQKGMKAFLDAIQTANDELARTIEKIIVIKYEIEGNVPGGVETEINPAQPSSIKLKENVKQLNSILPDIHKMRGVSFDWKKTKEADGGVIAEELEKVIPAATVDIDGIKHVKPMMIIGYLIETIKELSQRVEELEDGNAN